MRMHFKAIIKVSNVSNFISRWFNNSGKKQEEFGKRSSKIRVWNKKVELGVKCHKWSFMKIQHTGGKSKYQRSRGRVT